MIEAPPLIQTKVQLPEVPKAPEEITLVNEVERERELVLDIIKEMFQERIEVRELKATIMDLEMRLSNADHLLKQSYKDQMKGARRVFDTAWAREFGDGLLHGSRDRIKKEIFG